MKKGYLILLAAVALSAATGNSYSMKKNQTINPTMNQKMNGGKDYALNYVSNILYHPKLVLPVQPKENFPSENVRKIAFLTLFILATFAEETFFEWERLPIKATWKSMYGIDIYGFLKCWLRTEFEPEEGWNTPISEVSNKIIDVFTKQSHGRLCRKLQKNIKDFFLDNISWYRGILLRSKGKIKEGNNLARKWWKYKKELLRNEKMAEKVARIQGLHK